MANDSGEAKSVREGKALDWDSRQDMHIKFWPWGKAVHEAGLSYLRNRVHNVCLTGSLGVLRKTR